MAIRYREINKIKQEIEAIIMSLYISSPFYAFILKSLPIYVFSSPIISVPAFVTEHSIYISVDEFLPLSNLDKKFILVHEATHIIMKHSFRIARLRSLYGKCIEDILLVADAKVNQYISSLEREKIKPIMPEDIEELYGIRDTKRKSLEEIVRELPFECKAHAVARKIQDIYVETKAMREKYSKYNEMHMPQKIEKKQIFSGDPELRKDMDEKEVIATIEKKIISAYVASKIAGKIPGNIEVLVKEILKPAINWRSLLRYSLRDFISSRVRRTYSRPNKKMWINNYTLIPGKKLYGGVEALVLVDTSGSISKKELVRFMSEIYGILKYGKTKKIEVIPWDVKTYDSIILRSYADIEKIRVTGIKLKGRGGTKIIPVLREALEKCNKNTCVIIMSDFVTLDAYRRETKELLKQISKKASKCIMLTTYSVWDVEGWEQIKIET